MFERVYPMSVELAKAITKISSATKFLLENQLSNIVKKVEGIFV